MKVAYLAADRPDIAEAVKCLSQHMSGPRESDMVDLKRLIRYLQNKPRLILNYRRQDASNSNLEILVDSDWAGDILSRRSTSGMIILRGTHVLRHSSTLQVPISLSSAEAEYYAMVRGACYGLAMQANYQEWNLFLPVRIHSDSLSGRAFAKRKGLGAQRHVQTRFLWLQDRVKAGHITVVSIPGKANAADMLTKALSEPEIQKNIDALMMAFRGTHTPLRNEKIKTSEGE